MYKTSCLWLDQDMFFSLQIYMNPTVPEAYIMVNEDKMDFHESSEIHFADLEE